MNTIDLLKIVVQDLAMSVAGKIRVFISHASDDLWVAQQISNCIEGLGASTFLDRRDIAKGDNFRQIIRREIEACDELLALFTPWSHRRTWLHHELGMADILGKRLVCVFYQVQLKDFDANGEGRGVFDEMNIVEINDLPAYFMELQGRIRTSR